MFESSRDPIYVTAVMTPKSGGCAIGAYLHRWKFLQRSIAQNAGKKIFTQKSDAPCPKPGWKLELALGEAGVTRGKGQNRETSPQRTDMASFR